MVAAYTWHPRIAVTNPRWPLAKPVLEDELLSSWLVRNAFAHACSPLVLTGHLWPGWRCWTVDIDRGLTLEQGRRLSKMAGIALPDISSCTLRHLAHAISPWLVEKAAIWPWVLAIGSRNRRHAGGLQCCPYCLDEGVPYYRVSWRLAWHTCCEKHGVRLIDSCPHCGVPLQPHRLQLENRDCAKCFRCGARLRASLDTLGIEPAALAFQAECDKWLCEGQRDSGTFGGTEQWFYHSRFAWGLLRTAANHHSKTFNRFREAFGIGKLSPPVSGFPMEMLPVTERMPFLSAVGTIMAAGPEQFYEVVLESSMTRTSAPLPAGACPARLRDVIETLPLPRRYTKSSSRLTKRAVSRAVVMRKWARLKRKILRDG
jgi:hypothetical protein